MCCMRHIWSYRYTVYTCLLHPFLSQILDWAGNIEFCHQASPEGNEIQNSWFWSNQGLIHRSFLDKENNRITVILIQTRPGLRWLLQVCVVVLKDTAGRMYGPICELDSDQFPASKVSFCLAGAVFWQHEVVWETENVTETLNNLAVGYWIFVSHVVCLSWPFWPYPCHPDTEHVSQCL